eukprot:gnl/MRDRNA2_/MRDRNA2_14523_c0_seq1.p1 gnl/MRDRNA2_/MRDRNA2_14523_c0~~gnl/MRDRNA2_/MRDRNA2_14523_c0_seq1.p1  ORF type:complete len:194 (-),score=18.74 gnl/MRDRNA2_/MRDRNA2_14523_c0_seq1:182-763(-)
MSDYIVLNIGGCIFETTKSTLCQGDNFFTRLFMQLDQGMDTTRDTSGHLFIDRDGSYFGSLLNFLRTGILRVKGPNDVPIISAEAKFFGIEICPEEEVVFEAPLPTVRKSIMCVQCAPRGEGWKWQVVGDYDAPDKQNINSMKIQKYYSAIPDRCSSDEAEMVDAILKNGFNLQCITADQGGNPKRYTFYKDT